MSEYDFSQPLARKKSWKWEYEAIVDGHRVLPMSVADTDFISPREVTSVFREIIDGGEFGYPSYPDDHREVFAAWQKQQHGWDLHADNVIIANGLLSSLALMLEAVSAPGEGVIIFTPVYHNFFEIRVSSDTRSKGGCRGILRNQKNSTRGKPGRMTNEAEIDS